MIAELHDAKSWRPKYLYLLIIALATTFLTSNILAFKVVQIMGFKFGAAAALFPFSLLVGDALSEVYGFRHTRFAVVISLVCYLFFVAMSYFTVALPPAPEWPLQVEYEKFYGTTWRIFIAGLSAFLVSQLLNALVMVKIKAAMRGRNFYVRALAATFVGEFAHTAVGAPIVFASVLSLPQLVQLIFGSSPVFAGKVVEGSGFWVG